MKHFLLMLVVMLAVLAIGGLTGAEEAMSGEIGQLQWEMTEDGTLTIRGTGEMCDFELGPATGGTAPWGGRPTAVIVEEGVTRIGSYAFYFCENVTSFSLPDTLTSIGERAFEFCMALEEIELPENLEEIGQECFRECRELKHIEIPDKITEIKGWTFQNCGKLETVVLPESVKAIGDCAFENCAVLNSINLPAGLERIGSRAFDDCTGMQTIEIPGTLANLGENAFAGNNAKRITPKDSPAAHALGKRGYSFRVPGEKYDLRYVYSAPNYTNFMYVEFNRADEDVMSVEIPEEVYRVGSNAFWNCVNLTSVTIPDGVIMFGIDTFHGCESLRHIDLPEALISIENYLFYGCTALEEIVIPENVGYLYGEAFLDCTSLKKVTIPAACHIERIGGRTFENCRELTEIVLPPSVKQIDGYAFYKCSGLQEITIPASVTRIGGNAFDECSALTDVYFCGTEDEWRGIEIQANNSALERATMHYNWMMTAEPVLGGSYLFMGPEFTQADEDVEAVYLVAEDLPLDAAADGVLYSDSRLFACEIQNIEEIQEAVAEAPAFSVSVTGMENIPYDVLTAGDHSGILVLMTGMPEAGNAVFTVTCTVDGEDYTMEFPITFRKLRSRPSGVVTPLTNPWIVQTGDRIGNAPDIRFADAWSEGTSIRAEYRCQDPAFWEGFEGEDSGSAGSPGTYYVQLIAMNNNLCMSKTVRMYVTDEFGRIREQDYAPFGEVNMLPEETTEIHAEAFAGTKLTEISIPADMTYIAADAFDGTGLIAIYTNGNQTALEYAAQHGMIAVVP